MEYKLLKEKRRTIAIKIEPSGDVLVKAPPKASLKFINDFVLSKQKWIISHQQKLLENNIKYEPFYTFKKVMILGEVYDLSNNILLLNNKQIIFKNEQNKKLKLKNLIKEFAENYIFKRTNELASLLNLSYNGVKIISAKKKWGSCTSTKDLKFNYKLAMLPKNLIDYVICHELCHLKELNHSQNFWKLLEKLGYHKKNIRIQMKEYSFALNIF